MTPGELPCSVTHRMSDHVDVPDDGTIRDDWQRSKTGGMNDQPWRQAFVYHCSLILGPLGPVKFPTMSKPSTIIYASNNHEPSPPIKPLSTQEHSPAWPIEEVEQLGVASALEATVAATVDEDVDDEAPGVEETRVKRRNGNLSPNWDVWSRLGR